MSPDTVEENGISGMLNPNSNANMSPDGMVMNNNGMVMNNSGMVMNNSIAEMGGMNNNVSTVASNTVNNMSVASASNNVTPAG